MFAPQEGNDKKGEDSKGDINVNYLASTQAEKSKIQDLSSSMRLSTEPVHSL